MSENEIPDAETWRLLQAECPHCGWVVEVDELSLGEIVPCDICEKPFIPVE